jgi:hypothetical protein
MAQDQRGKAGLLAKRREKKRLKQEQMGDSDEKKREHAAQPTYDPGKMAEVAKRGGAIG